mmetsp:Transcript_4664/g.15450  ORF Transcript_4664/g.15450 Transcript_4664/m.15450 type:complete len:155 (-) Transcript_4664:543-1007(-)
MYMIDGPPFTKDGQGRVFDRRKTEVVPYKPGLEALHEMHTAPEWKGVKVGYASRTEYPEWAMACLGLIEVGSGVSMKDAGHYFEIYPGNKKAHFKRFHEESGIPYSDMLFFDNERRNCTDVGHLGVTCIYTPDGMTERFWKEGLKEHARRTDAL